MTTSSHEDRLKRRAFIANSARAAAVAGFSWGSLGAVQALASTSSMARGSNDYKALVCVFLFGGNDSVNTIIPVSADGHGIYAQTRPDIAIPRSALEGTVLNPLPATPGLPGGPPGDGFSYAVHPSMSAVANLFNSGKLAVLANVGPLLRPMTRPQYEAGAVPVPPQLFSHSDQQNFWQTSQAPSFNETGWGGRLADLLDGFNANPDLPMAISLDTQSLYARGSISEQYVLSSRQVQTIDYLGMPQNSLGAQTYEALLAEGTQAHPMERSYARIHHRSIRIANSLRDYLNTPFNWDVPFPENALGRQLRQVANVIRFRGSEALNMQRQIFFVSLGGFDTHSDQLIDHANLLQMLSQGLNAFYQATAQLGVADQVTSFTASDFGRTLTSNGDGTDHGWGGHQLILGGAVRGQRFFGRMPQLTVEGNPDDTGFSQLIPSTSTDQYVASLASWFGVDSGGIGQLLPNLGAFPVPNLRFMRET